MLPPQQDCLTIWLADDDADDCLFFKDALDELGGCDHLTTVHNGDQLMKLLYEIDILPDILFLDLNMPRKNGMQCLREIKKSEILKNLPVIIYSTSFQRNEVDILYQMGAIFYLRKPNDFEILKLVIHQALTIAKQLNYKQPLRENFVLSEA